MSPGQVVMVSGFYKLGKPIARIFELDLDVPEYRLWSSMLTYAGGALSDSPLHHRINEKTLPKFKPGKQSYALLHFDRFVSNERALWIAEEEGYRKPAHPRAVLEAARRFDEGLPEELNLKPPYSLATLVPIYKDFGEQFVLRVEWDKELKRHPSSVMSDYLWEPEYCFLFEGS